MPRWGLRLLYAAGALVGAFLVVAVALQVPAVGRAMGSPAACATCHLMNNEVVSMQKSAHKDLRCVDCHSARPMFLKPIEEIRSASVHLWATVTASEPDLVQLRDGSRRILQANCQGCHEAVVVNMRREGERQCTDCHRFLPHDRPNFLRN